jgi:hypothetical protein
MGRTAEKQGGEVIYGPAVVLSLVDNSLRLIEDSVSSVDKGEIEHFHQVAQGKEKPSAEGAEVFRYLKAAVLKQ